VSDVATRLFSEHRPAFERRVRVIAANPCAVRIAIDKALMFRLCDELGVPVAPREIVKDYESLVRAIARLGFPCVVKPVDATEFLFGRKALILKSEAEVRNAEPRWPENHRELCVQRFVGGPPSVHAHHAAANDHRPAGTSPMDANPL
jgi:carbamoylphosphate synthase large subunit